MQTLTLLALSLLTGTIAITNHSQSVSAEINEVDSSYIAQLPTADIQTIARDVTVRVKVEQDRGSGILIAGDNNTYTVITNAHVTERGDSYTIVTPDGIEHQARLVDTNTNNSDLAVLEFSSDNTYRVATIGNSNAITEGETVTAAGFPEDKNNVLITNGTITYIAEKPLNKGYSIGFTNETVQGMSGGVLLNSSGEVIGILGKGKDAILDTAYNYSDGTTPKRDEIAQYRQYSFSIPISDIALISPQLAALVPDNTNQPEIAQQPEVTPTPKTEYTGIVKTVDDIAQQITVRLATAEKPSYGSGVIIAKDGNTYYVATVRHNFPEGTTNNYQIVTSDGESHQLDLNTVKKSDAYDFALFSFTSDKEYTVATIGNYTVAANRDQTVFTSGFPGMYAPQRIITGGKVREQNRTSFAAKDSSSFISTTNDRPGLLYSNISYKGMSGGAVLDSEGRLVGINTGAENELYFDEEGNNSEIALGFSLGIPLEDVLTFIDRKTPLKTEWLQTINSPLAKVSDNDYLSIKAQLLTVEIPEDETDLAAWMNYGNGLWRYERYEEAISAFEQVIAINPKYDKAYYAIGLANFYRKNDRQVVIALEKATQINSSPYFYWRYLGYSYAELKKYDLALTAYENAIKKNSQDFVLYVEFANVLEENQNYKDAIISHSQAISLNPNHSWAYNNRGSLYSKQGKLDLAISDFNQAIEIDPFDAITYYNRGNLYSKQEKLDLAISDYSKAIKINPQFSLAYYNRGVIQYRRDKLNLAIFDYSKAIEANPSYALAYYNRGVLYEEKKKLDLAISDYSRAIEANPSYADAYNNRGNLYYKQGELDLAISDYSKAIEANPSYALAYYNRGVLYEEKEKLDLAISDYSKAIAINPQYASAYYNRGNLYSDRKQWKLSLTDYNKAIEIDPQDARAYANLGIVYWQLKNIEQARINFQKAQKLFVAQGDSVSANKVASLLQQLP